MIKFFALFLFFAFSFANATESAGSLMASSPAIGTLPRFYDDQLIRQSNVITQTPVNLEGPIDSNYIIGPGDFFEILIPNAREIVQVSPEGTIAIYDFGLIKVSDLELFEAKQLILERMKNRYDKRFIGIHLVQLRKYLVNVQGAVWSPGQVTVSGQAKAREAVYSAGHYKPTANRDSIYIHRKGETIATTEDILLQAGDIIEVPHKEWRQTIDLIYAGRTLTVPYIPNRILREYVKEAGINMDKGYVQVSMKKPEYNFTKWISIEQIDRIVPDPLDEIEFHMQMPFVYVGGAVLAVGKVPYDPSMSAADYVAASGVSIITGDFSRVSVLRNGKRVSVDWAKGEILPGDFIEIPRSRYEQIKDVTFFFSSLLAVASTAITIYLVAQQ
ncbi:MAG: SLBB domain-containing protein [Fibromonadaceae bacterium]|jgi:protein involved in polysaccharide export with SLBB domain|nr:SLBB domain-containing protein [Fibromonadaceae bacterium]